MIEQPDAQQFIPINAPEVLATPIEECGEAVIDVKKFGELELERTIRNRDPGDPSTYFLLRDSVIKKLVEASKKLPPGIKLFIKEGLRTLDRQLQIFSAYANELCDKHSEWDEERIYNEACKYASPPRENAPHSTGGAVDLTLIDASGKELDMGTEVNETPEESENRCFTNTPNISEVAKQNRKLLIDLMTEAGFVNYSTEWWHWSYGDQYWAHQKKQPHAIYGSVKS